VYAFAAAVQPGPLQAYLISRSLAIGWRKTVPSAFAPLLSDGPIIVVVLFVLSTIPHGVLHLLQCVGGIFLLFLAYSAFREWKQYNEKREVPIHSGKQSLLKATMINLINPNAYLGWSLVMGPLFLRGWRESPADGLALLVGFYGTLVVTSIAIILLVSRARNLGPRVLRASMGIAVIGLAGFGCYQLWLGILEW